MTTRIDVDGLAARLWKARLDGTQVTLSDDEHALTIDDAYELQQRYVHISGERACGWKIGATNQAVQDTLGVDQPFAGPILERFTLPGPVSYRLHKDVSAIVEVEFVFRMASDFTAHGDVDADALTAAIDAICPAIELAGLRLAPSESGPSAAPFIADAAANIALIYGTPVQQWSMSPLAEHPVSLQVNGVPVAEGNGGNVLGSPINALGWLAEFLGHRGLGLSAGDIITTGSATPIQHARAGDTLMAEFGALGSVEVSLE